MAATPRTSAGKIAFDSPEQAVFLHLWRTYDCLKAVEHELFAGHDLSAQQYNALRLLQSVYPQGMPSMILGRRLISRCPDTTRLLDRLEQRKLVTRTRQESNRRVVQVALTPAGLAMLESLAEAVVRMHRRQLGHLSAEQQRDLVRLLQLARRPHDDATCDWLEN